MKKIIKKVKDWLSSDAAWIEWIVDEQISNLSALFLIMSIASIAAVFSLAQFDGTAGWQFGFLINAVYSFWVFASNCRNSDM